MTLAVCRRGRGGNVKKPLRIDPLTKRSDVSITEPVGDDMDRAERAGRKSWDSLFAKKKKENGGRAEDSSSLNEK